MSTSFKAYFRDHFRSKRKVLLCALIFALALTFIYSIGGQKYEFIRYEYVDDETYIEHTAVYYDSYLGLQTIILCTLAYSLPVLEFSFFKKRRNLDCAYALPISRREMGLVHYFTGLLCMIIPFVSSYLLNFLLLLRYPEGFYYPPLAGYFFLNLLIGIILYSVFTFVFNQANSTGDGVWFIILWSFAFGFVAETVRVFLRDWLNLGKMELGSMNLLSDDSAYGISWGLLSDIQWKYTQVIEKTQSASISELWSDLVFVKWFVLWILLGIGSVLGFVFSFGKRGAEQTQEVSDSWFGFKLLIPLYAICGMVVYRGLFVLVIWILAFVGYIIYRKGFHLKKWDWIILGTLIPWAILCGTMYSW